MILKPLADKIVVKKQKASEITSGGIILTTTSTDKQQIVEVLAVGTGCLIDGNKIQMMVSVGDNVVISKYAGTEVMLDEEEYIIINMTDVLAIVEK